MLRDIALSEGDAAHWAPATLPTAAAAAATSLVVSNPPWDVRIEGAAEAWASLGLFLRREASGGLKGGASGGDAWLLSGNPAATKALRMKATAKVQ